MRDTLNKIVIGDYNLTDTTMMRIQEADCWREVWLLTIPHSIQRTPTMMKPDPQLIGNVALTLEVNGIYTVRQDVGDHATGLLLVEFDPQWLQQVGAGWRLFNLGAYPVRVNPQVSHWMGQNDPYVVNYQVYNKHTDRKETVLSEREAQMCVRIGLCER